jgi:hypothetical protein
VSDGEEEEEVTIVCLCFVFLSDDDDDEITWVSFATFFLQFPLRPLNLTTLNVPN